MSKLIFLDIDGTIAMPGTAPSRATTEAIRAARKAGHKVFLSTGRTESSVDEAVLEIGFDGGIFCAGGRAVIDGKVLIDRPMPEKLAVHITDVLRQNGIHFLAETDLGVITPEGVILDGSQALLKAISEDFFPTGKRIMSEAPVSVYKLLFRAPGSDAARRLEKALAGNAKVVFFRELAPDAAMITGEISDPAIHKGAALEAVCRYLDADIRDTVAFGDSMNDAEILKAAGTGVAMGNADPQVKAIADLVCGRCEDDGLAEAFLNMKLI